MGPGTSFIAANRRVSRRLNALFPGRVEGILEFLPLLCSLLRPGMAAVDIGGGRSPVVPVAMKQALGLHVTGVDVSAVELSAAPAGAYDRIVSCDAAQLSCLAPESADIIYSRAVLEHVSDPRATLVHARRALRPGGVSAHYVPNKWALFALVNSALPPRLARRLLYATKPEAQKFGGFKAYYRETTPRGLAAAMRRAGFREIEIVPYYMADYLDFFLPAHAAYVGWQTLARRLGLQDLCESFAIVGRV